MHDGARTLTASTTTPRKAAASYSSVAEKSTRCNYSGTPQQWLIDWFTDRLHKRERRWRDSYIKHRRLPASTRTRPMQNKIFVHATPALPVSSRSHPSPAVAAVLRHRAAGSSNSAPAIPISAATNHKTATVNIKKVQGFGRFAARLTVSDSKAFVTCDGWGLPTLSEHAEERQRLRKDLIFACTKKKGVDTGTSADRVHEDEMDRNERLRGGDRE